MLLQRAVMVAKKLLVGDKITACVKHVSLWVLIDKRGVVKHFAFLKTVCCQNLNFVLLVMYFFYQFLIGLPPTWNVLLFSCNPVGQLCLSGPSYSSRTVIPPP